MYLSVSLSYYFSTTTNWSRLISLTSSLILIDPFSESVGLLEAANTHLTQRSQTMLRIHLSTYRVFALPPGVRTLLNLCADARSSATPGSQMQIYEESLSLTICIDILWYACSDTLSEKERWSRIQTCINSHTYMYMYMPKSATHVTSFYTPLSRFESLSLLNSHYNNWPYDPIITMILLMNV